MIINRVWAMPNKWTFRIKPIAELLARYVEDGKGWIDPFAGMTSPAEITNDLNPTAKAQYHLDATEFAHSLKGKLYKGCLFDPPYTYRQICETYHGVGIKRADLHCNNQFYGEVKDAITPLIANNGLVIHFGYHSNGFGKTRGFTIEEVLLVAHGGAHYDTIVTVERKL